MQYLPLLKGSLAPIFFGTTTTKEGEAPATDGDRIMAAAVTKISSATINLRGAEAATIFSGVETQEGEETGVAVPQHLPVDAEGECKTST